MYLGRKLYVKEASAANTHPSGRYPASNLIDNDIDTYYASEFGLKGFLFWIQLELEDIMYVDKIELVARKDCCHEELSRVTVRVGTHSVKSTDSKNEQLLNLEKNEICRFWPDTATGPAQKIVLRCDQKEGFSTIRGRFVTIYVKDNQYDEFTLAEATVYGIGLKNLFLVDAFVR